MAEMSFVCCGRCHWDHCKTVGSCYWPSPEMQREQQEHAEIEAAAIIAYEQMRVDAPDFDFVESDRTIFEAGFALGIDWMLRRIKEAA